MKRKADRRPLRAGAGHVGKYRGCHLQLPIQAPAGRGGIAPNLALAYNSDQGNGWVGLGWTLDMGAIQRSTKTPGGLTYSTSDQFVSVIIGTLFLVPNTNWGPGKYENEIDGAFLN